MDVCSESVRFKRSYPKIDLFIVYRLVREKWAKLSFHTFGLGEWDWLLDCGYLDFDKVKIDKKSTSVCCLQLQDQWIQNIFTPNIQWNEKKKGSLSFKHIFYSADAINSATLYTQFIWRLKEGIPHHTLISYHQNMHNHQIYGFIQWTVNSESEVNNSQINKRKWAPKTPTNVKQHHLNLFEATISLKHTHAHTDALRKLKHHT